MELPEGTGPGGIKMFDCWVCGTSGVGKLDGHQCKLDDLNKKFGKFLHTPLGRFYLFIAERLTGQHDSSYA